MPSFLSRLRPPYRLHHVYERQLGTELEVQVVADTRAQAESAESAALDELERLRDLLNRFDPQSEFSRWLARPGENVTLSPELLKLLERAESWQQLTGGAFHPGADALGAIWNAAAARGQVPDPAELARQVEDLRRPLWTRHEDSTASLHATFPLGLNAFAKGFIVDRMVERAFAAPGVRAVLINAGGDLRTLGGNGLTVQVADPLTARDDAPPLTAVKVKDGALATSGSAHRGYQIGGKWYSHLIDPRSGQPIEALPGVTVTAPDCETADALATALSVLDVQSGLKLVESLPGCAALVVQQTGEKYQVGWPPSEA